jgi:hypothetical protein
VNTFHPVPQYTLKFAEMKRDLWGVCGGGWFEELEGTGRTTTSTERRNWDSKCYRD